MKHTRHSPLFFIRLTLLLLACSLLHLATFPSYGHSKGARPQQSYPGLRTLGVWDTSTNTRIDVIVWYPSIRPPSELRLDGIPLRASLNSREIPGRFPVILLSHSLAGTRLGNYDVAAALATQGFIVIGLTHPGDNIDDTSLLYSGSLFHKRPAHLVLAYQAVLHSPQFQAFVDPARVGLLGVGSGAATVLQLAGLVPEVDGLFEYCKNNDGLDPYCTTWAQAQLPRMKAEFTTIFTQFGPGIFTPALNEIKKNTQALSGAENTKTALKPAPGRATAPSNGEEHAPPQPATVSVLKSIALLSPGLAAVFPDNTKPLSVPLTVIAAENDAFFPVRSNAQRYAGRSDTSTLHIIRNAEYASLQAPCPPGLPDPQASMCSPTTAPDEEARLERNKYLITFFQETLGAPLPPLEPKPEAELPAMLDVLPAALWNFEPAHIDYKFIKKTKTERSPAGRSSPRRQNR